VTTNLVTKLVQARATGRTTTKVTSKFMFGSIIYKFGCPIQITSDQGTLFFANFLKIFMNSFQGIHRKRIVHYLRANELVKSTMKYWFWY